MIIQTSKVFPHRDPTTEELGELTDRFYNLLQKFKGGKTPVHEVIHTLQLVGDGHLILEEMLSKHFVASSVPGTMPGYLGSVQTRFDIRCGSDMDIDLFSACLKERSRLGIGGSVEVFEFGRPIGVPALEWWKFMIHGESSKKIPKREDIRHFVTNVRDCIFYPDQLRHMLERGSDSQDGSAEWSYKKDNFLLCWAGDDYLIAQVRWHCVSPPRIYLQTEYPERFEFGERFLLKRPIL